MSDAGSDPSNERGHDPADRWIDRRRHAPATERNRGPIGDRLADILPAKGVVLEIASGSGEHALYLARRFPALDWLPSDPDPDSIGSIAAWREAEGPPNLRAPVSLDASAPDWPVDRAEAMLCVNMIHISPLAATEGLFAGAARVLPPGAPLAIYGPFLAGDIETAPSNLQFDQSLRARDPRWGLRDLADVVDLAGMAWRAASSSPWRPANNLFLHFQRI